VKHARWIGIAATAVVVLAVGCRHPTPPAQTTTADPGAPVATDPASEALRQLAQQVTPFAQASHTANAATEWSDIKAALMADPTIDSTAIRVERDEGAHAVTLVGIVGSEYQRDTALHIALTHAPGWNVRNELVVMKAGR
jgi:BON domain